MSWRAVSLGIWALLALLLVCVELAAVASGHRLARIGDLFGVLTSGRLRRAGLLVSWMWLGWHFFAR